MKRTALFFLLSALSQSLLAQNDTIDLTPVEVRAIRATEKAPFAKTNITRTEIERVNLGQDLPFLLQHTPSVVVHSDAGNGVGYTGIRIRGTDPSRINVTLNGVPFNDAESNGTFFVDLPDFLSSVNSVQVQRGVGTSSNGPGAFGATINLSTNEVNRKRYAEFNNSYGSFNTLKNTIRGGTGLLANRFTVDARVSRIISDGYIDRASSKLHSVYFSSAYLNEKSTLRFNFFSGKEKTYQAWNGVPEADLEKNRTFNSSGTEKPGTPYDNETDNYRQDHYQFFVNRKLNTSMVINGGLFFVRGKGYYEQYKGDESYEDYGMKPPVVGNDTLFTTDLVRQLWLDNHFYGTIYSADYRKGKTSLTVGGALSHYEGSHFGEVIWASNGLQGNTRWYQNKGEKTDFNIYTKWQQKLAEGLELYADVQWRNVHYRINGFRNNPALQVNNRYGFFNPKLGLSYAKGGWYTFASYGVAHKEPNRDDFEAGVAEQPKAEKLGDLELGMERKGKGYTFGGTFYYMRYRDQLVLTGRINDVGAYTRTNIRNSYRAGVELQGQALIQTWLRFSGNLALSRNRISHFTEYLDDYDQGGQKTTQYPETVISFSPSIIGSSTFTILPFKRMEIDFVSKYVGEQFLDNTASRDRMLDDYFTQDVRALYQFSWGKLRNVQLIGQVNNVFNHLYEPNGYTFSYYYNNTLTTENFYYPMAGINFMVGLNVRL